MEIFIYSRSKFKEIINGMSKSEIDKSAIISIHSPKIGMSFNDTDPILSDSENVLNLWFHDTDPEAEVEWMMPNVQYEEVLFDEEMAKSIKRFVLANEDKKRWIIHCTAGKCRSGAVGEVLSDFFKIPYSEFKRSNPQIQPNIYVKKILKKVFDQTLYSNYCDE